MNTLDLVGFVLNRKKSELDLTQDIQFLGIRLHLDLGEASLPESKAWEIVAHARQLMLKCPSLWGHSIGLQFGISCPTALGSNAPGPPGYDRYGQLDSSFVYQQTRRDTFPYLVAVDSRASPLVRGSEHNSPSKTYPRLSERDSRPPISSEPANTNRVVPTPEIVRRIFRVWGTPEVDMFATLSNSHLPRFMSPIPEPRALAVDALSQDWQGKSMYMFPPFPLLNKVMQ